MARQKKRVKPVSFPLRLTPPVYASVKEAADKQDESMNALLVRIIEREYPPKESQAA